MKLHHYFLCFIYVFWFIRLDICADNQGIHRLPISVTGQDPSQTIELELKVPINFCQANLVKRSEGGVYKKEYMRCEDLAIRKSDKMFYIFYNKGSSEGDAAKFLELKKQQLTTKVCTGYEILYEKTSQEDGYSKSEMIISCTNMEKNVKILMLLAFFVGEKDSCSLNYDIKLSLNDPEDFAISEILQNLNNENITILRGGKERTPITFCADYYNKND